MLTACERLLSEVRSVNRSLRVNRRIRVIAADPPINWAAVQVRDQFLPFLRNRVDFGAEVIAREILQKRKKALLVFGHGQLMRSQQMKTADGFVPLAPTIAGLIDRDSPGRLYVVVPAEGSTNPSIQKLEAQIGTAKRPVLLVLRGTPFGSLEANDTVPQHSSLLLGAPTLPFHVFRDGIRMADVADACIYRGRAADPVATADPVYDSDKEYAVELQRRARIAAPPRR